MKMLVTLQQRQHNNMWSCIKTFRWSRTKGVGKILDHFLEKTVFCLANDSAVLDDQHIQMHQR